MLFLAISLRVGSYIKHANASEKRLDKESFRRKTMYKKQCWLIWR